MKKKQLGLLMLVMSVFSFTIAGCGKDDSNGRGPDTRNGRGTDASTDVEPDDGDVDPVVDDDVVSVYEGTFKVYPDDEYPTSFEIKVYQDGTASFSQESQYSQRSTSTYSYLCDYKMPEDDVIVCTYTYDDGDMIDYKFTVNGNEITSFEEAYGKETDFSEIAGTYTNTDDKFGDMELTVELDGTASLITDNGSYYGTIFVYDGDWDFMGDNGYDYDDPDFADVDLIIDFTGADSFTYVEYAALRYSDYEGEYHLVGALGDFDVTVNESGEATCTVKIDGKSYDFEGNIDYYEDYYESDDPDSYGEESVVLVSFYLHTDDDMYNLSIDINELDDGSYNYYGTLSKTLGAG